MDEVVLQVLARSAQILNEEIGSICTLKRIDNFLLLNVHVRVHVYVRYTYDHALDVHVRIRASRSKFQKTKIFTWLLLQTEQ